jgi:hypothetical protein
MYHAYIGLEMCDFSPADVSSTPCSITDGLSYMASPDVTVAVTPDRRKEMHCPTHLGCEVWDISIGERFIGSFRIFTLMEASTSCCWREITIQAGVFPEDPCAS